MKVRILSNNCFLIDSDSWLYCQSYETIVGMYNKELGKVVLGRKWNYSRTTLKHIKLFLAMIFDEPLSKKVIDDMIDKGKVTYDDMLVQDTQRDQGDEP